MGHASSTVWKRAFGELVLIVGGVLIALALDSWREEQQERQQETAYLQQLLLDLRETEERLNRSAAGDSAILGEISRVLDRAFRGKPPPGDSFDISLGYSPFRPLIGTQMALVQGGDLRLLQSDSIRFRLIAYSALMDATEALLRHTERLIWNMTEPIIHGQVRHSQSSAPSGIAETPAWREIDVAAALSDPALVSALQTHALASRNRIGNLRRLEEPLSELIRLVEVELKRRWPGRFDATRGPVPGGGP